MSRLLTFDAKTASKEYQGHWIPVEAEDYLFNEEADYALPNVVIALASDSGDVIKYAAFGRHPVIGRCANASTSCWCAHHPSTEDHTLEITAH